jgi:predicted Zn-ribbon and HTH transcriptional regulator
MSKQTLRQRLAELLARQWYTVADLARDTDQPVSTVADHLPHVRQSHRDDFKIDPPRCRQCGFEFSDRDRLSRPSRCPECREERISAPRFHIG